VLMVETGHFASLWKTLAEKVQLKPTLIETDWRRGADPNLIEEALKKDSTHNIKGVCVVHNETSTGCTSQIALIRQAIDNAGHPALLMVDTISGLASADFRFDEWRVDIAVSGSQKGLMLPPGLSFNAVSEKAIAASKNSKLPKSYWSWDEMLGANERGYFPYTPATNLLFGLAEAIDMINEEGLENVFIRHQRHSIATIGHLGDFNDLMLMGTLAGIEMGLHLAEISHNTGGTQSALDLLKSTPATNA